MFVLGHKAPDVDSTVSSLLMEELLRWQGRTDAEAVLLLPPDAITASVIERLGLKPPRVVSSLEDIAGHDVFLVDHNDPRESVGAAETCGCRIVGIVDHHEDRGVRVAAKTTAKDIIGVRLVEAVGSCAQLVLRLMRSAGCPAAEEPRVLRMVLTALAVDTCCLMTTKTTPRDRVEWDELRERLGGVSEETLRDTCLFEIDVLGNPPSFVAQNGLKEYALGSADNLHRVCSSYVELYRPTPEKDAAVAAAAEWLQRDTETSGTHELSVFVIRDFARKRTWVSLGGKLAKQVEEMNGGHPLVWEGVLAARATDVMPRINALLARIPRDRDM